MDRDRDSGGDSASMNRPRSRVTRTRLPNSPFAAVAPRHTTTCGRTTASSLSSHGRQAAISSLLGRW